MALKPASAKPTDSTVASGLRTLTTERAGLDALAAALATDLAGPFAEAVALIRAAKGRVIVTGVGKSGHVARKVASTFASTGTPAFFVHPAEASHGDLGMVTPDDVIVALSWSGESAELKSVVEHSRRFRIPLVAFTAAPDSALGRKSDIVLQLPRAEEACPHGLSPTTSTVMQLALGDALAIALLEARGFSAEDFHVLHPGGRLGASLHFVRDVMHEGDAMPLIGLGATMGEAIMIIGEKRLGCVGVIDQHGKLAGIITDGDVRRNLGAPDQLTRKVEAVMTKTPKTIAPDALVGTALDLLNKTKITALFVLAEGKPVGVVHMHDLLRIGVA
ncbi:MAG TPA: KpsF/GutQ family sugar-phosphate isomerase [Bauldia sp.]|nr:KpsF/GutQ family sugar-phosphate isomerase [Bauldia sp.]